MTRTHKSAPRRAAGALVLTLAGLLAPAALLAPLALPTPALAQPPVDPANEPPKPPTPGKPDKPPILLSYIVMALLVAAALGANLIPAKRGHQD